MEELLKAQNELLKKQLDSINTIKYVFEFFLVMYLIGAALTFCNIIMSV